MEYDDDPTQDRDVDRDAFVQMPKEVDQAYREEKKGDI
jgi:hypothetical protein